MLEESAVYKCAHHCRDRQSNNVSHLKSGVAGTLSYLNKLATINAANAIDNCQFKRYRSSIGGFITEKPYPHSVG